MGFLDKAKQLADQAQQKLDEVQKDFNKTQTSQDLKQSGPATQYDKHGRPVPAPDQAAAPAAPPAQPARRGRARLRRPAGPARRAGVRGPARAGRGATARSSAPPQPAAPARGRARRRRAAARAAPAPASGRARRRRAAARRGTACGRRSVGSDPRGSARGRRSGRRRAAAAGRGRGSAARARAASRRVQPGRQQRRGRPAEDDVGRPARGLAGRTLPSRELTTQVHEVRRRAPTSSCSTGSVVRRGPGRCSTRSSATRSRPTSPTQADAGDRDHRIASGERLARGRLAVCGEAPHLPGTDADAASAGSPQG